MRGTSDDKRRVIYDELIAIALTMEDQHRRRGQILTQAHEIAQRVSGLAPEERAGAPAPGPAQF